MSASDLAIKQLKQKVRQWRQTKSCRSVLMPLGLWQSVIKLCSTHEARKICRDLNLDYRQLKARLGIEGLGKKTKRKKSPGSFVTLTLPQVSESEVQENQSCEFIRVDGVRLRVMTSKVQLSELVSSFLGGQR